MVGLGAAAAAALIPQAPAEALIEGYSPMSALKGKDYGKSRMTCAPVRVVILPLSEPQVPSAAHDSAKGCRRMAPGRRAQAALDWQPPVTPDRQPPGVAGTRTT